MSTWSLSAAKVSLRNLLADNATDKLQWRKNIFGKQDGTNKRFKTFEFRRITDFSAAPAAPLGVYVDGTLVSVAADYPEIGELELSAAPDNNATLEATYYSQWFKDDELETFLSNAVGFIGVGNNLDNIPIGLQNAALQYAAADAYQALALQWARNYSEGYRLEDAPDLKRTPADVYNTMANAMRKQAQKLREEFYTRKDQSKAPLFTAVIGKVGPVTPPR